MFEGLLERERAAGALMSPAGNYEVARSYGDPAGEYLAAREGAALFDLSLRAKVLVSGEDRLSFLHGVISANMERLEPGRWAYAALLEPKGKYLADLKVLNGTDEALLDSSPFMGARLGQTLDQFRFRSKVAVRDVSRDMALLALEGPEAVEAASLAGLPSPGMGEVVQVSEPGNSSVWLARVTETGAQGVWTWSPWERAADLWDAFVGAGARPAGLDVLATLRIEAGVPTWGRDIDEGVIPMEAGQERALDFEKCYPGQEVVSRIHYRGHVNRYLQILEIDSREAPPVGAVVATPEREVGTLTSVAVNPVSAKAVALGYVRRDALLKQEDLRVLWEGRECAARARPLPYSEVL